MAHPGYVSAVYIDDRVQTERWVRRRSLDLTADPFAGAPDEADALRESVELLLGVCHQSKGWENAGFGNRKCGVLTAPCI